MIVEARTLNATGFPAKIEKGEVIKIETAKVREIEVSESRNLKIKNHFERLRKNLRKGSRNIL